MFVCNCQTSVSIVQSFLAHLLNKSSGSFLQDLARISYSWPPPFHCASGRKCGNYYEVTARGTSEEACASISK